MPTTTFVYMLPCTTIHSDAMVLRNDPMKRYYLRTPPYYVTKDAVAQNKIHHREEDNDSNADTKKFNK